MPAGLIYTRTHTHNKPLITEKPSLSKLVALLPLVVKLTWAQDETQGLTDTHVSHGTGPLTQWCSSSNIGPHHSYITWHGKIENYVALIITRGNTEMCLLSKWSWTATSACFFLNDHLLRSPQRPWTWECDTCYESSASAHRHSRCWQPG